MAKRKAEQGSAYGKQRDSMSPGENLNAMATTDILQNCENVVPPPTKLTSAINTRSEQASQLVATSTQSIAQPTFIPANKGLTSPSLLATSRPVEAVTSLYESSKNNQPSSISREAGPTTDNADASNAIDSAAGNSAPTDDPDALTVTNEQLEQATSATKNRKRVTARATQGTVKSKVTTTHKKVVKKAAVRNSSEHSNPKRINKNVRDKVRRVNDFLRHNHASVLTRLPTNDNFVIVPESLLTGAMMAMHIDYGMSDDVMKVNANDVIKQTFEKPMGTLQLPVKHYVVDVSSQSLLEQCIRLKIKGHLDTEEINLLEVQLEMNTKQLEESAASNLFASFLEVFDEDNSVKETNVAGELYDSANMITARETNDLETMASCESAVETNNETENIGAAGGQASSTAIARTSAVQLAEGEVDRRGVCTAPRA